MSDDGKELKDQRVVTMMSPSELEDIDDWSFRNRIRSRGEAIRRLCKMSLVAEHSRFPKAVDEFVEATMALVDLIGDTPSEDLRNPTTRTLEAMFDVVDEQIADTARSLPLREGGDIREDIEQTDRMVDFLQGKSVMKLIDSTPGMKERLSARLAQIRREQHLASKE